MPMLFKFWFRRLRRVSRNRHIQRITVAGLIVLGCHHSQFRMFLLL